MHQNLAEKLARSATMEAKLNTPEDQPWPWATEDEMYAELENAGGLYEVEITVAADYADRVHPDHGPWTVVNFQMDVELEDLTYDPTDKQPWRWGLAEDGWDGTIEHAAKLIAECQGDVDPAEIRPWRVRVWDFFNRTPAVYWGLSIEDAAALAEARRLAESEPIGHLDARELIAA